MASALSMSFLRRPFGNLKFRHPNISKIVSDRCHSHKFLAQHRERLRGQVVQGSDRAHPKAHFTAGVCYTLLACISLMMGCHQVAEVQDELALHLLGSFSLREDSWELGGVTESFDSPGMSAES